MEEKITEAEFGQLQEILQEELDEGNADSIQLLRRQKQAFKSLPETVFPFGDVDPSLLRAAMVAGPLRRREIPPEDYLFVNEEGGGIFSTVDLVQVFGGTGAGKTLFILPFAVAVAAGRDFMHWKCVKPRKVIYFDGELAEITIKERLELANSPLTPEERTLVDRNLFVFNRDSMLSLLGVELAPLDSLEGRLQVEYLVDEFKAELTIFDSRFCLLKADMKESDSMPKSLILSQRSRKCCAWWAHHSGKDMTRGGYGDKTAEFLMDTNIELVAIESDTRIDLKFHKKRKSKPVSASLYADITIEHREGEWFESGKSVGSQKAQTTLTNSALVFSSMVEMNVTRQDVTGDLGQHYIQRDKLREHLMDRGYFERTSTGVMEKPDRTAVNKAIRNLITEGKLEGDSEKLKIIGREE